MDEEIIKKKPRLDITPLDIDQLLRACERGDLGAVKVIVERLGIDVVNATGDYGPQTPRKVSISMEKEAVSPIFLAAGFCHLDIAQYLIDQGAEVNSRSRGNSRSLTYDGMTPLHSAICLRTDKTFSQKIAMIELLIFNGAEATAITSGGCDMWTIFCKQGVETSLIIDLGVRLTRQFPGKKFAALHYWTSCNNVRIIELLLEAGADLKSLDYYGLSTLNVAAIGFDGKNESVLRYLLARDEFSLSEKVIALELVGAMTLLKATDGFIPSEAFRFWIESLDLRENAQGSIAPKVSLNVESNVAWRSVEWTTRNDLVQLQHGSSAQMKVQAILVSRRILSSISSKALACCLWTDHFENFYYSLAFDDRFTEVLEIYWIFLEGARVAGNLCDRDLWEKVDDATYNILNALWELEREQNLNSETLNLTFELVFNEMHNRWPTQAQLDRRTRTPMSAIYELVLMLLRSPAEMVTEEIKNYLRQFVERDARDKFGYNLLLYACLREEDAETLAMIRFLLEVAHANPNTLMKDDKGDRPLHLVVVWMNEDQLDSPKAALLLQHGAHIDVVNNLGQTPLDVWKNRHKTRGRNLSPPDWLNPVHQLYCWSARVVRRSGISYDHLPKSVKDFVDLH